MERFRNQFWQMPGRLSPRQARLTAGLAVAALALALATLVGGKSEVPPRLLSTVVLALAGLGNLAWALGSLLPEAAGSRRLRQAARLLFLLLLLASVAFLTRILYSAIVDREGVFWVITAAVGGLVVYLAGRLRRQSHNGTP